jgi:DNA-binding IscR family transcriptional regulator
MKLSQTTAYAIAAMAHIVNSPAGQVVSNTAICNACQMPDRYVSQLMRKLVIVDSRRRCRTPGKARTSFCRTSDE